MKISFIMPGRNNLKYAKWSYDSIQKNKGDHEVEICFADDDSSDGTWDWANRLHEQDPNFKIYRNTSGKRVGHTILYDKLVNDLATNEICMIWHCDMYLCPGALDAIEKEMYSVDTVSREELEQDKLEEYERKTGEKIDKLNVKVKNPKTIVSLTRIEPPLHPPGPEKILLEWGATEPEDFDEDKFLEWFYTIQFKVPTEGVFAPWAFWKSDFQEIGGHDPLYAPQSKEDSDIFNRFQLNGIKFKQVWDGFVYHMTCRGSRRNTNDKAKDIYTDSPEWLAQNERSARNFVRKWGHFVRHNANMKPIIPHKYDIGYSIKNCTYDLLHLLEPWCSTLYLSMNNVSDLNRYLLNEQKNTKIDLLKKVRDYDNTKYSGIVVEIDCNKFTQQDFQYLQQLPDIIEDTDELGSFVIGNLEITITDVKTYEDDLIKIETKFNKKLNYQVTQ